MGWTKPQKVLDQVQAGVFRWEVAQGTPEEIAKDPASVSGPFLKEIL